MTLRKKALVVIGGSGVIGMDVCEKIRHYVSECDVIAYDRPTKDTAILEDRAVRKTTYKNILAAHEQLLDSADEAWLLQGRRLLPEEEQGKITYTDDYLRTIAEGVDAVVITAGASKFPVPEDRSSLTAVNAPIFKRYGAEIADLVAQKITEEHREIAAKYAPSSLSEEDVRKERKFHIPVIMITATPPDLMTEVMGRSLHSKLMEHSDKVKDQDPILAKLLSEEAGLVWQKIIGQGNLIDEARAARAIEKTLNERDVQIDEVVSAPVYGTHNEHMILDFDAAIVRHNGKEMPLYELSAKLNEKSSSGRTGYEEIQELTVRGGWLIKDDYKKQLGIEQTSVFGTAAALTLMVDAVVHNRNIKMAASVFNTPEDSPNSLMSSDGVVMGARVTLNKDGAIYTGQPRNLRLDDVGKHAKAERDKVNRMISGGNASNSQNVDGNSWADSLGNRDGHIRG